MGRAVGEASIKTAAWRRLRIQVLERDAYECQVTVGCGRPATCVDHILPRSRGGQNHLDNLRAACKPCNSRRGDRAPLFGGAPPTPAPLSSSLSPRAAQGPTRHVSHAQLPV